MRYYSQQLPNRYYALDDSGPNNPSRPMYPLSYARPVRPSAGSGIISIFFMLLMITVVGWLVYLGLSYVGFDQITQIYGFEQVIATAKIHPPPSI